MCGRYSFVPGKNFDERFSIESQHESFQTSFNVAPGQDCLVMGPAARKFGVRRWGLVPSWSKSDGGLASRINACAETLTERYGRFSAHPTQVRAALYPRRIDKISDLEIFDHLRACEKANLIRLYRQLRG